MDQIQIHIVQPELLKTGVKGGQRGIVALVGVPELCGDEDLLEET
jgi:hypothetical protein